MEASRCPGWEHIEARCSSHRTCIGALVSASERAGSRRPLARQEARELGVLDALCKGVGEERAVLHVLDEARRRQEEAEREQQAADEVVVDEEAQPDRLGRVAEGQRHAHERGKEVARGGGR